MPAAPSIIPPDALLNIPHLGRLLFSVRDPQTVWVETVERNQNPKFADADHLITINNVEYTRVRVVIHSDHWWTDLQDKGGNLGSGPEQTLIWTTDGKWAARSCDITARRADPPNRGNNMSPSALAKLVKRVMLFLDGYMPTEDAQRMIHECDIAIRQAQIAHSRDEIKRLNNLLDSENKKLSAAMRVGMEDLIDLRRALLDGDSLEQALYGKDPDD